ncbi:DUF2779 domain-containing protein [Mesoplasma syrphidae]|uniref:DUF2779 domain-containing protein n=1 Tax=Mesoplasma syrphidae TaxID=225999 RepID=A0A2K9BV87_9MOLU|nr:DUF2779 domain-containing protein [Mesoplasma syrphidae]AUF83630.1 DUF2779 domain-containing protein [Mesoplasma syrphidae]
MEQLFKTRISKETFKTALSECIKKAWIYKTKENFVQALAWKQNHIFQYAIKDEIESEDNFNEDASQIDIYETYANLDDMDESDRVAFLKRWDDLWADPNGFEISKFAGETIEDGNAVGEAAREYFDLINADMNIKMNEEMETISFENITNFKQAVELTNDALDKTDKYRYIYEAAFEFDDMNLRTRCDILKIKPNMHVEIIEVKATSTVKVEHFYDLVYQVYVLEKNGFIVDNIHICHLKDNYLRGRFNNVIHDSLSVEAKNFFDNIQTIKYEEVLEFLKADIKIPKNNNKSDLNYFDFFDIDSFSHGKSKKRATLIEELENFKAFYNLDHLFQNLTNILALNAEEIKGYFTSEFCETRIIRNRKNEWIFATDDENNMPYCNHVMPWFDLSRETFMCLTGLKISQKANIILNSKSPYFDDYATLFDSSIPQKAGGKSFFKDKHHRIFESYKNRHEITADATKIIDPTLVDKLSQQLAKYEDKIIYMYDFETVKWAIPNFDNSAGYQQIPFQYSIDVIFNKDFDYNHPETMKHFDFIGNDCHDPRPHFIEKFVQDMFSNGPGIYVAYNDSFEKTVLKYLAFIYPEYSIPLMYIIQNTVDLMDFFKGNDKKDLPWFLIYHPDFHGSYSIKKTQPALDPKFSYKDLKINQGAKAAQTFREYVDGRIPDLAWEEKIKPDMLKYCNRDTLAMVVIYQRILEIYQQWKEQHND